MTDLYVLTLPNLLLLLLLATILEVLPITLCVHRETAIPPSTGDAPQDRQGMPEASEPQTRTCCAFSRTYITKIKTGEFDWLTEIGSRYVAKLVLNS